MLELSPSVFSILSSLVDEKVGLHYGSVDRTVLQQKASSRALEAGFDSLLDYYYFLRYDEGGERELSELVETLVVNETYLFREWTAIRVLVDSFIAPWCAEGRRPRIWSAACATGEEPLSLAMLLDSRGLLNKVDIVATDISTKALTKARGGRYGKRSVRQVPNQELLDKYVTPEQEGYSVPSRLIEAIHWQKLNLLSKEQIQLLGKFDVILCRNVLIYFSDKTVMTVLDRLAQSLVDDGALFVGVSESLMRYGSRFVGEEHGGAFVYRKSDKS